MQQRAGGVMNPEPAIAEFFDPLYARQLRQFGDRRRRVQADQQAGRGPFLFQFDQVPAYANRPARRMWT